MSKTTLYGVVSTVVFLFAVAIFSGGDESTADAAQAVAETVGVQSSGWFWGLFVLGFLIHGGWTLLKISSLPEDKRKRLAEVKFDEYAPPKWAFVLLIGLPLAHWLFWSFAPALWNAWFESKAFWPTNFVIVALSVSLDLKKVGVWVAIASVPVAAAVLLGAFRSESRPSAMPVAYAMEAAVTNKTWDLPAEIVLPIIAECESGGRQFDDEGNLITNPESSAVGKFQIMASLHEERARGMGFDIRTEEGNEAYAKFLFSESRTEHWEADPRSRACWEPKLLEYGYGGGGAKTYVAKYGAPVIFAIPPGHRWDMVGEIPSVPLFYEARLDGRGYRVQTIEVAEPGKEASFQIAVTRCQSNTTCAW